MNSELSSTYVVAVALQGRVPVKIIGSVKKGDILVSAANGFAQACSSPIVGSVIGKALEDFTANNDNLTSVIEIVVKH
jgi:hypothetical protein